MQPRHHIMEIKTGRPPHVCQHATVMFLSQYLVAAHTNFDDSKICPNWVALALLGSMV